MELGTLRFSFKNLALAGIAAMGMSTASAQTNITVDANANWVGGMLCFDNTDTQPYLWYSDWAIADVKTEKNTTDNTLTLYPNYNTYDATNAYWSNGAMGNKILEGLTMVIDDALATQQFTFTATVTSFTLSDQYTPRMFVKTFDANWGVLNETYAAITGAGTFSIPYNATMYTGAAHVQYGFSVRGLNANPADMNQLGNLVVTAGTPEVPQGTEVTISATSPVVAYANWFTADGATYIGGSSWGLAELKTVLNEDGTLDLHPNFNTYGDGTDPYWANGEIGAKVFEGNTYIDDATLLGQTVTFKGHCVSNTLATGYAGKAFIKVLDANYGIVKFATADLVSDADFNLTVTPADYTNGAHFQYGYSVTGLNGNPAQEAALGFAKVNNGVAAVATATKNTVTAFPNPAGNVLNLASQNNIEQISIYNMLGQNVLNTNVNATTATLNVSNLAPGVYILNAASAGKTSSVRFVKK